MRIQGESGTPYSCTDLRRDRTISGMPDHVAVESISAATTLVADIKRWGADLGSARLVVAAIDLAGDEAHFRDWLLAGFNGEMKYMSRHGAKRTRPNELVPGTVSCISARMDYWPAGGGDPA